jgi:hypothetical protein
MTWTKAFNFSDIEDLIADQGDIAIVINELQDTPGQFYISAYQPFDPNALSNSDIIASYLTACDPSRRCDFSH